MITLSKVLAIMIICLVNPGCKFNGTTKVRYTNQFDDLIDLSTIRNVYINEEELVEIE